MNVRLLLAAITTCVLAGCAGDGARRARLVLAATTSIEDTGLLDELVASFSRAHPDIEISAIAVGTGQALELGRRGDADVLVSHDSAAEAELVRSGTALRRENVMFNYFVIAGPPDDPAGVRGGDPLTAFRRIAARQAAFISRGDDSGTHRRERSLWRSLAIEPQPPWYVEAGLGMGDALLLAGQKRAYVLSDHATFLRFRPRIGLERLSSDDSRLRNLYGVTVLSGPRARAAEVFARWITGDAAQQAIATFGVQEFGVPLFQPAARSAADTAGPPGN